MNSQTTIKTAVNAAAQTAEFGRPLQGWRLKAYTIIFEADTKAGRLFDLALIAAVLLSLALVMLESVASFRAPHQHWLTWAEYSFTALFTLEYLMRLACVRRPLRYATSFFGIVDLLAVLPIYLAFFVPEMYALVDVRVLRLLRVFRILKLNAYVAAYMNLGRALRASSTKILVFLSAVLMIVLIMGTVMYVVEGPENGFTSIPVSVYWAISTVTTVGFGDITPKTDLGRAIASLMMLLGWGVLAVPTGIMTTEMAAQRMSEAMGAGGMSGTGEAPTPTTRTCHACLREGLQADSHYCRHCGAPLPEYQRD
ncbi:ion transporter [Roseateles oligotrophus]|uniref:Ion transporter n=1 Tax=Roseateles oligotrophus TaxID=1769250 RepID=A0ABT2YFL3_9BURK|nr:ion transporter [Roseateles oligotrophus]MCV2368843.1 ion transporter [Roseateles oligotrophus]